MFSNAKQSIPELFKLKMEIDGVIQELRTRSVIEFKVWNKVRKRQAELRHACEKFISNQKLTNGPANA